MAEQEKQPTTLEIIEGIKDTEEFKTLLNNHANSHFENNVGLKVGEKVKEAYTNVDNAFKNILGVDRPSDKKTSEWAKEIALEYKTLKENAGDTTKLEEAIEQGKKLSKAQIEKLKEENQAKDTLIQKLQLQGAQQVANSELSGYLAQKTFNPAYSEQDMETLISVRKQNLIKNSKQFEGKTIYYKDSEQTQPYLDTIGNPMTAKDVADKVFGSLYHVKTPGGNGVDSDGTEPTVKGEIVELDVSKIKSKKDLYGALNKALAAKGLAVHEEEALKIQRATIEHYGLKDLPRS